MENSLSPAFVVINYHSSRGAHLMTLPTVAWSSGLGTNGKGGYIAWDTNPIDAEDMITAFATAAADLAATTIVMDGYTIFTKSSPTAPNLPVASGTLALTGTDTNAEQPAGQFTASFRTTDIGRAKITLLDFHSFHSFLKARPADVSVDEQALFTQFTDISNAWSGRDGARPQTFISGTYTLNEKLRREYGMT